jgi:hypothetical protein
MQTPGVAHGHWRETNGRLGNGGLWGSSRGGGDRRAGGWGAKGRAVPQFLIFYSPIHLGPDGNIFDVGGLGCASTGIELMPSAAGRVAHCPICPALAVLFALFRARLAVFHGPHGSCHQSRTTFFPNRFGERRRAFPEAAFVARQNKSVD